jgi:predicted dehydrogenase
MAREHARAFAALPDVELVGIHSRTRSRAESLAADLGISTVSDSVAELYDETSADLVMVAVSEMSLNPVCQACFEHPWTLMTEKPPGYDLKDGETIREAARASDRQVLVAMNRRFLSSTRSAAADLGERDGKRYIRVQDQQEHADAVALRVPDEVFENWMYANSIHLVDYLRVFGRGAVRSVDRVVGWDPADPGPVVAKVEFESGDVGVYECIWNAPGPWSVSVSTPDVRWEMRPLEQASYQPKGERRQYPVETHQRDADFKPGFLLQAEAAVEAAMGRPSGSPTLDDAMETMRLIGSIYGV